MIEENQYERIAQTLPFLRRAEPQARRDFLDNAYLARIPAGHDVFVEGDQAEADVYKRQLLFSALSASFLRLASCLLASGAAQGTEPLPIASMFAFAASSSLLRRSIDSVFSALISEPFFLAMVPPCVSSVPDAGLPAVQCVVLTFNSLTR